MKHTRKNKKKCPDYGRDNFIKRWKVGLQMDHDGGHQGSAKDIKEAKTHDHRQKRRVANNAVRKQLDE